MCLKYVKIRVSDITEFYVSLERAVDDFCLEK